MNFHEQLIHFLSIKCISKDGNEDIINYLIPHFEDMGAKVIVQQVSHSNFDYSKRQFNIIGILGDDLVDSSTRKGLLLLSHVDTANPGDLNAWTELSNDPWMAKIDGNKIFGLGAANAKLDFLCKLNACKKYAKEKLNEPIYLVATCGAESPILGAKYLVQSNALNPKYVLIGHPTSLNVITSQKASLVLKLRFSYVATERDAHEYTTKVTIDFKGKSCHASTPAFGNNAVQRIFATLRSLVAEKIPMRLFSLEGGTDYNKIPDQASVGFVIPEIELDTFRRHFRQYMKEHSQQEFEIRFGSTGHQGIRLLPSEILDVLFTLCDDVNVLEKELRDTNEKDFDPAFSTVSINGINQGRDFVDVFLHFSLLPKQSTNGFKNELETRLKDRIQSYVKKYSKITFEQKKVISIPAIAKNDIAFLQQLNEKKLLSTESCGSNVATEAAFFYERNYPVVIYGPGQESQNTHCANEYNEITQIDAAIDFYSKVIETFCL